MSSMIGGRSGNRGQCAQPCRLPWRAEQTKKEQDILSLKDLCTIRLIPELVGAGITSFKIEGRMKQPSYVETVTSMYRKYTDLWAELEGDKERFRVSREDQRALLGAYTRRGYTDGYYTRHNGREMLSLERPEPSQKRDASSKSGKESHLKEKINGKLILSPGKSATLTLYADTAGKKAQVTVSGDTVQEAQSRPLAREQLLKQMKKTGNTEFALSGPGNPYRGRDFSAPPVTQRAPAGRAWKSWRTRSPHPSGDPAGLRRLKKRCLWRRRFRTGRSLLRGSPARSVPSGKSRSLCLSCPWSRPWRPSLSPL